MATTLPTDDPWADIPRGSKYQKWTEPGDELAGVVIERRTGSSKDGDPCPEIVVERDDTGEPVTVTAAQVRLKNLLLDNPPQVGDSVRITFTGTNEHDAKTFRVKIARQAAPADPELGEPDGFDEADDYGDEPF